MNPTKLLSVHPVRFPQARLSAALLSAIKPKAFTYLLCLGFMALFAAHGQAQILLSTWNFNNDSRTFVGFYDAGDSAVNGSSGRSGSAVGSFSTSPASYGEGYTPGTGSNATTGAFLASNTAVGAVYSGSGINLSFTNTAVKGSYDANTGYCNDYGYGTGFDAGSPPATSAVNPTGGSGGAGSLLVWGGGSNQVDFNLSSRNYTNLRLSFQLAAITFRGNTDYLNGSYSLSYSLNGGNTFAAIGSVNSVTNGATFALQTVALPDTLNNLDTFDLRVTFNGNGGPNSGFELDDFQLTAVPEPSTWVISVLLLATFCFRFGWKTLISGKVE